MSLSTLSMALYSAIPQGIIWGIMALGVYLSFRLLNIADMSCEGTFASGAAISAILMVDHGFNPYLTLIFSILIDFIGGMITGIMHTKFKIPAILAGILTQLGLYSINLHIMGASNVPLLRIDTVFNTFAALTGLDNTTSTIVVGLGFAMIVVALIYAFFGTEIGSAIRATGCNPSMAKAQGIDTDKMIIIGLGLSNALIALSGALVSQSQGYADVKIGQGAIVIGLAAIIIGEVLLSAVFKRGNFVAKFSFVFLGSIFYRIIVSLVLQMGLNTDDLKLFSAILVMIALATPAYLEHQRTRSAYNASLKGDHHA